MHKILVKVCGHSLDKRTVYVSDDLFYAVYQHASKSLKDAMDLAYLTGQRPGDPLKLTHDDIVNIYLIIAQEKTKQPLRIVISGKLEQTINRIIERKSELNNIANAVLVNEQGKKMTAAILRNHFTHARKSAMLHNPEMAHAIKNFWFYDLRAKAADDTSDQR